MLSLDQRKNKTRIYLSNGDRIKRIGLLPASIEDSDCMQIKLKRQVGNGIDFIYDLQAQEMKLLMRYTFLEVNDNDISINLNYLINSIPALRISETTSNTGQDSIIDETFFDNETKCSYKIISILDESTLEVLECDFMTGETLGEKMNYDRSKAMLLIEEQS